MELYNAKEMPLSSDPEKRIAEEKLLKGEQLTLREKIKIGGHDNPLTKIGSYECKPNHCYRCVSLETFEKYKRQGFIGGDHSGEYLGYVTLKDGSIRLDNSGVDWYLGGFGPRYGRDGSAQIIIECPAYKEYFTPTVDNGLGLSSNLNVRQMKSSGSKNPIPMSLITDAFNYTEIRKMQQSEFLRLREQDIKEKALERENQLINNNIGGKSI